MAHTGGRSTASPRRARSSSGSEALPPLVEGAAGAATAGDGGAAARATAAGCVFFGFFRLGRRLGVGVGDERRLG